MAVFTVQRKGHATVSTNNLTRDEAAQRAQLLTVTSYDVQLDFTDGSGEKPGEDTFGSVTTVRFTSREPGRPTYLDLTTREVRSITLNGGLLDVDEVFDGNRIQLPGLAADNEVVVDARCLYMRTGEGVHRFVDPVDGSVYLYTPFETFDAHRMYACFDQPDLKSVFTFTVRAPRAWFCASIAPVIEQPAAGERGSWSFATSAKISYFISPMIACPYAPGRPPPAGTPPRTDGPAPVARPTRPRHLPPGPPRGGGGGPAPLPPPAEPRGVGMGRIGVGAGPRGPR